MARTAFLLFLLAGCATIHARDVQARFAQDYRGVQVRAPAPGDLAPGRAANPDDAMRETVALARAYLDRARGDGVHARRVRALLACACLLRGREDEAVAALHGLRARAGDVLSEENRLIAAAIHAVDGCHAVEAYRALEALFDGQGTVEDYLARYGVLLGVPPQEAEAEARRIRESCFARFEQAPRAMERLEQSRRQLREVLAGQIYNDAAQLLVALPPAPDEPQFGPEACLAAIGSGLLIVYAQVLPDLLAGPLNEDQKVWLREQVLPFYGRGKEAAGHYLSAAERAGLDAASDPPEPRRLLYARLLTAEVTAVGWISTR